MKTRFGGEDPEEYAKSVIILGSQMGETKEELLKTLVDYGIEKKRAKELIKKYRRNDS